MTVSTKRLVAGAVAVVVVIAVVVLGKRGSGSPIAAAPAATTTTSSATSATSQPPSSTSSDPTTPVATAPTRTAAPVTTTARATTPAATATTAVPSPPAPAAPAPVQVVVPVASWSPPNSDVEIGAYVEGVIERGGTCVVTMTKGALTATGRTAALPSATNTSCGDLRVPGSAVSSGSWTATVSYTSPTSSGTSAPTTIEVP